MLILTLIITVALLLILGWQRLGRFRPYALTTRELLITILCSFFPILLSSLIRSWFTPDTFISSFVASFEQGQAFLYTSAFLSTFFVLYIKDTKKPPGWILVMLLISSLGGALLYTFSYSSHVMHLQSHAPKGIITFTEISIVACVFIVWFWSTLPSYKNHTSGAEAAQRQQEDLEKKFMNKEKHQ